MYNPTPKEIVCEQIPVIHEIIKNETWYEGERRKHSVEETDLTVQKKVQKIILDKGHILRQEAIERLLQKNAS